MSAEHGIDLAQVEGSGQADAYQEGRGNVLAGAPAQPTPQETPASAASQQQWTRMMCSSHSRPCAAIAQHMVQSKHTSPHVTTIMEVDMTAVVRHREANKRTLTRDGETPTYTPHFVAAIVAGLRAPCRRPTAASDDDGILLLRRIHVGIAGGGGRRPLSCRSSATPTRLNLAAGARRQRPGARAKQLKPTTRSRAAPLR